MAAALSRGKISFLSKRIGDIRGGRVGGWVGGLVGTRKAAGYIVTVPWLLPLLPSIQLCIIGLVTDGLLLPLIVMAHPSWALTRQSRKS